jgi:hypothetical protein
MTKIFSAFIALLFICGLAMPAVAQQEPQQPTAQGSVSQEAEVPTTNLKGEHEISGTISKLDTNKGMVSLQTDVGMLELHFPPQEVKELKAGDTITVRLGYSKGENKGLLDKLL